MSKPHLVTNSNKTNFRLAPELLLKMHSLMVRTRTLEERMIKMYKQNDGFFWIGGPGEEAFNIPLGLLFKKGQGPQYDYFHGHYRSTGVLVAMGANALDFVRQMKNTATDPFSGGRNFIGHSSIRKWNVAPISSPIEIQYSMAPGTALANKRKSKDALTAVVGGDAGTAEGDFATCLIWSSRPGNELPILIIVTNNSWGISTAAETQHGDKCIADRGKAFGMKTMHINGLDAEESYLKLKEAMDYVRTERKPLLLEARVSRLYGHSSASGANFVAQEEDPIKTFESRLEASGLISREQIQKIWSSQNEEMLAYAKQVREEPQPSPESIWDHVYCGQKGKKDRYW
ncbi:MAG: thiamine pyrophosphate-dependent dehydrogenase E1 component subunit alpha [Bdellovibrionota bacterium]